MRTTRTRRLHRWSSGLVALTLLGSLAGCSDDIVPVPRSSLTPPTTVSATAAAPEETPSVENDLDKLPLKRKIKAGPLKVEVEYTTRLTLEHWQPNRSKPLHVSLEAVNEDKSNQKVYLTKVTANATAYDSRGQVGDASSVSDKTDINPGFIVTSPNSYNQSLAIPAVDSASLWMTIDLTYELVMEVSKTKEGRDFAKQVATDTITVPLAQS
ncbi:MAG: hypothetical protein QM650_08435 [Microlunatus sp.]